MTELALWRLGHSFFARPVLTVARDLIGCLLVHDSPEGRCVGAIVETEAYGEDDPGSHARAGRTNRTAPMFEEPGRAYVYFTYGVHWCLNAVTDRSGKAGAVLIRAVRPLEGAELMQVRRGRVKERDLCRGPGRLCQAFDVDGSLNRTDLTRPPLYLCAGERHGDDEIATGPRIGLGSAQDGRSWRFWLKDSEWVSGPSRPKPAQPKAARAKASSPKPSRANASNPKASRAKAPGTKPSPARAASARKTRAGITSTRKPEATGRAKNNSRRRED